MKVLFLFLDGIGLGEDDPEINPFAHAKMPLLRSFLGGQSLVRQAAPYEADHISLTAIDAGLGVKGLPQSATGQAVLLTGRNIPELLGYHYGPKPNPEVAKFLDGGTLFSKAVRAGRKSTLLNAYPPRYFDGIDSGKRLYSAFPLAFTNAGHSLFTRGDYYAGRALSADFTGAGWREFLDYPDAPYYEPHAAGKKLGELASENDFSLFEYWASDYAGHKQDMKWAVTQLEILDEVLGGLLESWKIDEGLILLTSDHGNMEDLSTRRHTNALIPLVLFGQTISRRQFSRGIHDLTGIAPAISNFIGLN